MSAASIAFGPFSFDPRRQSLQSDGKDIPIGARGLALFAALMEADGGVVDRASLLERAWPGLIVEESNLTVQIAALRKALGTQPDGQEWIATVPRIGYRLTRPAEIAANGFSGKPSIAILPFANFSEDSSQGYFVDGMVEDLITALSRFKTFAVVSRNSTFAYKDRTFDIRDAARELGVRYVLEGSVRRAGDRVRVTAQLIEAATGAHIWAEKFDGTLGDVFDFHDHITASVVSAIEPQIRKAEIERSRRKRPESLDAYDLYLRALPLIQGVHAEHYSEAIVLLERAMALDPGFAPVLALACWAHAKRVGSGGTAPPGVDDAAESITLANLALAADSTDAMVLAIAGLHIISIQGSAERGYAAMMRALELNPNSFLVVNFAGYAHVHRGNFDAAVACHLRALQLCPASPETIWALSGVAGAHLAAGHFEDALIWGLRSLDVHEGYFWTHAILAASYAHLDRLDEARSALKAMLEMRPGLTLKEILAPKLAPTEADRTMAEGLIMAGLPER